MTETPQGFWAEEFDLSALSHHEFLEFFFNRPVVAKEESYELFRKGIDDFIASNPQRVVEHLGAMCREFSELATIYSAEQLDQGLWAVFGPGITCERYLFDSSVKPDLRVACIESMYLPFRDVAAQIDSRKSFYFMWWDMILHTFWQEADGYQFNYSPLSDDGKCILEATFHTLVKILAIDDRGCQWCALHGLGHLHHPEVPETVQRYLENHGASLSEGDVRWIERCRDGVCA